MDDERLLDSPWPVEMDPVDVPFLKRTRTVLIRQGLFDDPYLFDSLTAAMVADWWNAGAVTVEDIRVTGNEAIQLHRETAELRHRVDADLNDVAREPWASHIWHWDPRFAEFVPKGDSTVRDIATSHANAERRALWCRLEGFKAAVSAQAELSLDDAVSDYIEAVSGQHGRRLDVLLARTGFNGLDPIPGGEAARRLGVSPQRIHQIAQQLHRRLDKARPTSGPWLPQIKDLERRRWPDRYTAKGVEAIRRLA